MGVSHHEHQPPLVLKATREKLIKQEDEKTHVGIKTIKYNMGLKQEKKQAQAYAEKTSGPHDVGRRSAAPHHMVAAAPHCISRPAGAQNPLFFSFLQLPCNFSASCL